MIDLHTHILPGLDDGSPDLANSLAMARLASADGITHLACTPHVTPGIYDTPVEVIEAVFLELCEALRANDIALTLMLGADVHVDPALPQKLASGRVPSLNASRYFLFEPPHQVVPPRIVETVRHLVAAGNVPVLTHPERLTWIESHYEIITGMAEAGALVQLTAGSITGNFGGRAKYWSERLLDEGRVDIIASDAHNTTSRPPILSVARDAVAQRLGEAEALNMVLHRPAAIANNEELPARPQQVVPQIGATSPLDLGQWMKRLGLGGR